jgi:hypothetical protein
MAQRIEAQESAVLKAILNQPGREVEGNGDGHGIVSLQSRENAEGNVAVQLEVFGFVHHTHPAATELRENAIVRDGFADHAFSHYP